jgi:hypothetical protein
MDDRLKYFLSFMGYPRSGHTLAAAILNANPNVMCSNQLNVYAANTIDIEYIKMYSSKPETWKNTTQIPHVPKQEITVVGDKTGHRTVDILESNPQKLGMMKEIIQVPMKWIHVVRNPFDNLATWAKLNYVNKLKKDGTATQHKELDLVIRKYRVLNATIEKLRRSEDTLTVNHEFLITRMHNTLEEMANFLEISFDPVWRDNVRNTVWKRPRVTRGQVKWARQQKKVIKDIIEKYDWLDGYEFGGCGRC